MTDFETLDPQTRCYALVGKFLSAWAYMENKIDSAIGKTLDLNPLQEAIVCSNLEFRKKINILKSSLPYSLATNKNEIKSFKKMLNSLEEFSAYRNMIAHNAFMPSEDNMGVKFYPIKANSELKFLSEVWEIDDFSKKVSEINTYYKRLDEMTGKIGNARLVSALMKREESGQATGALGGRLFGGLFDLGAAGLGLLDEIDDEKE